MQFGFATAREILFGDGVLETAVEHMVRIGKRFLVVTGSTGERAAPLLRALSRHELEAVPYAVSNEPSVDMVVKGAEKALDEACQAVIGIGGGSVMDAAKAIAALMTNRKDVYEYLEVVGRGRPLDAPAAPCVAIPTTAGTGAEVTRNAVLTAAQHKVKVSLRHLSMLPCLAVVDPTLTHAMGPHLTAATGMDALTQLIEAYVSRKATPLTDGFCLEGLVRVARSLPVAYADGANAAAREDMALGSLLSGLALANGGLGAVHGLAAPLGGLLGAPHGMICAALLPAVLRANCQALRQREPESPALGRMRDVAALCTGLSQAAIEDGIAWVEELCVSMEVRGLSVMGLREEELEKVAGMGLRASSMRGNPVPLEQGEVVAILRQAL